MTTNFFEKLYHDFGYILHDNEQNVRINIGREPNIRTFKAHSNILKARSLYFKQHLNTSPYIMNIINVSVESFEIILKYIYFGTITLEKTAPLIILDLLMAANRFCLEELVNHIKNILIVDYSSWLLANFPHVYKVSFEQLSQFCIDIIAKYPYIIFEVENSIILSEKILVALLKLNFLQADEGKIWDYVIRWGIAQHPSSSLSLDPYQWSDEDISIMKKTLKNCLPLIRYFQLSADEIINKFHPYHKILDSSLWNDILTKSNLPNCTIFSIILPPRNIPQVVESSPSSTHCQEFNPQLNSIITSLLFCGKQHLKNKEYDQALADFNKLLDIDSKNVSGLNQRGITFYNMKKLQDALIDFNKSLKIESNNLVAIKYRGFTCRLMNKCEEALEYFNEYLKINKKDAYVLYRRGETYYFIKDYEKALNDLNNSLKLWPQYTRALNTIGSIFFAMGKFNDAITYLTKTLKIDKKNSEALKIRSYAYYELQRYQEALYDLEMILNESPTDEVALCNKGVTFYSLNLYEEALVELSKSLAINPNNENAFKYRGIVLYELTNLSMSNNKSSSRWMLDYHINDYTSALKNLTESLNIQPNNIISLVYRGRIYFNVDKLKEALDDFNAALKIDPNNAIALEIRSKIYFNMSKYEEAREDLYKLLELHPGNKYATDLLKNPELSRCSKKRKISY